MSFKNLRGEFDDVVDALRQANSARKVLLIGQRGAGKTSFLQLLQNLDAIADNTVESDKICQLHGANPAATQRAVETQISLGVGVAPLTVVDLPGWQDTDGTQHEGEQDQEHAEHIREAATSAQYLHCVVLVVNGTLAHAQPSVDHSLRELAKIYPIDDIRQRVVVLFTFCDSLQRRAFPVAEDTGLLGEIGRQEQLCFYLDNPLGRLAGLDKEDLVAQLADEGDDTAMEIRREVKKGAQTAVKLLKHISSAAPATPARATAPSSFLSSFHWWSSGSFAAPAAQTAGDVTRTKDPPVLVIILNFASAVAFPFLLYIGILCLTNSHMIELPQAQKPDAGYGCLGAALLYAIIFGATHMMQMQNVSAPQAREPQFLEMTAAPSN